MQDEKKTAKILKSIMGLKVLFIFVFLFLVLKSTSHASTVLNIHIPKPRGGYGDVATSILMIERLASYHRNSNVQIRVTYDPSAVELIEVLLPNFQSKLPIQNLDGVVFVSAQPEQQTELEVEFSSNGRDARTSQSRLIYREYNEQYSDFEISEDSKFQNLELYGQHRYDSVEKDFQIQKITMIPTGIVNGVYTLEGFRPQDFNKTQTMNLLSQYAGEALSTKSMLGYAYSASPGLGHQYIRAAEQFAKLHNLHIVIVSNHVTTVDPRYVKVVKMARLPFSLNQKIIKSSDLPILVTGDGSLSLAIEGKKPFFYALYAWKNVTPFSLMAELVKRSSRLRKDQPALDLISELLRLDISGTTSYEEKFLNFFERRDLQKEFSKVMAAISRENSLVPLVLKDIELLKYFHGAPFRFENFHREFFWKRMRKSESAETVFQAAEDNVFDISKPLDERLHIFEALVYMYTEENGARLISKALTQTDREFKFRVHVFIQASHRYRYLLHILPYLDSEAAKEYLRVLRSLAAQPKDQWGVEKVKEALDTIQNVETRLCRKFFL